MKNSSAGQISAKNRLRNALKHTAWLKATVVFLRKKKRDLIVIPLMQVKHFFYNLRCGRLYPDHKITEKTRLKEESRVFSAPMTFSILVPLYNTPDKFLREMIESVLTQTYKKFELCLADGSDEQHKAVETVCRTYAKKDSRIKYRRLERNTGISGNTNAAADMATGDYLVLFDHDDLLHPSALFAFAEKIEETDADFLYTDEAVFRGRPHNIFFLHYKPDFAPDFLRTNNYICHLSAFRHRLFDECGHFLDECNGSQDYDMVLKLTERANKVVHIPRLLYFWRSHKASVAGDLTSKPYVFKAAKTALSYHLARVGLEGTPDDATSLSTYRIRYTVKPDTKISLIIAHRGNTESTLRAIRSVKARADSLTLQVIVVGKNVGQLGNEKDVLTVESSFSTVPALLNCGAKAANGNYFCFMHDDCELTGENNLCELLMFAARKDVGAVSGKLYRKNGRIEQTGMILGVGGTVGAAHGGLKNYAYGFSSRAVLVQNLSVLSDELLMVSAENFFAVGGFCEEYRTALYDADFCLRLRRAGLLNVFTPYSEAIHYSLGRHKESTWDAELFKDRFRAELTAGDPYYNPHLSLRRGRTFHTK